MGVRIFSSCIALLAVLYVCLGVIDAAAVNGGTRSAGAFLPASKAEHSQLRIARQVYSDEDDSEEDDEVQAQNFAQEQQLQQQIPDDSQEESEEDGDDDGDIDRRHRRRRESPTAEAEKIVQSEVPTKEVESVAVPEAEPLAAPAISAQTDAVKEPAQSGGEGNTPIVNTPAAPSRNTSVLILIRDALKKVTTLPTEQVATNALQYFQLFEHFIQQTIEEVIGDDDEDEDEAATAAAAGVTSKPDAIFTPEEEELIAGVEEILKEPELVTKLPQEVKPAETQLEVANQKPLENETAVGETKPAPDAPKPEIVQAAKPATEPAQVETAANSV
ncbi:uncharacterized protein LOC129242172 [Anastrepha obliqua]|uniref:uncharacterized protein LOC129242172 n=1 Tax=Anastrepha obliqua TaxID=95512 RepID=UPI00240A2040|nr:uncharacterized protein LOC129242172 [Anastrepha obliqua]